MDVYFCMNTDCFTYFTVDKYAPKDEFGLEHCPVCEKKDAIKIGEADVKWEGM